MNHLRMAPFVIALVSLTLLTFLLDQWLGIVAHTFFYLLFCAIVALVFGTTWFAIQKTNHCILIALIVFTVLATHILLPPPSERLLRSAMLKIPAGTNAEEIERVVKEEYKGSGFVLPRITSDVAGGKKRVHVSLLSQNAGNCSAVVFIIENNVVARRWFSPD